MSKLELAGMVLALLVLNELGGLVFRVASGQLRWHCRRGS